MATRRKAPQVEKAQKKVRITAPEPAAPAAAAAVEAPPQTGHEQWLSDLCARLAQNDMRSHPTAELHVQGYDEMITRFLPSIVNGSTMAVFDKKNGLKYAIVAHGFNCRPPCLVETDGFTNEDLLPQDSIERSCDYQMPAFVTMDVYRGPYEPSASRVARANLMDNMELVKRWNDVPYFWLPCMVGSEMCNTRRVREQRLDLTRPEMSGNMGCFILSGQEKHMMMPMRMRVNIPIIQIKKTHNNRIQLVTMQCRSDHELKMRTTSTLFATVNGSKNATLPEIVVKIQFIDQPVDLCSVFVLLGFTDKSVMTGFLAPHGDAEHTAYHAMVSEIVANSMDTLQSQEDLMFTLGQTHERKGASVAEQKTKRIQDTRDMLNKEFLPHISSDNDNNYNKAVYFGLLIRSTLMVYLGLIPEVSRDSVVNLRGSGPATEISEYLRVIHNSCYRINVEKKIQLNLTAGADIVNNLPEYIPSNNNLVTSRLRQAINQGKFSAQQNEDTVGKSNLTQQAVRVNPTSIPGHMGKLITPHSKKGKDTKSRQMNGDFTGKLDTADTTEGETCGLNNSRANMVRLRGLYATQIVLSAVDVIRAQYEAPPNTNDAIYVIVNGNPLWRTNRPAELCARLRNMRRCTKELPWDVGVAWIGQCRNDRFGCIRVSCDGGEILSPLFVVDALPRLLALQHRIKTMHTSEVMSFLVGEGIVEYIGIEEQLCDTHTLTAMSIHAAKIGEHTWADVESSVQLLGVNSVYTPGANRNQGPRNSYHCVRSDTLVRMADYTEKPIRDVVVGDTVMCASLSADGSVKMRFSTVEHQEVRATDKPMRKLIIINRNVLYVTGDHLILCMDDGRALFRATDTIRPGQLVCTQNFDLDNNEDNCDNMRMDEGIRVEWLPVLANIPLSETYEVADITVQSDVEDVIVGQDDLPVPTFVANGIVVHNSNMKKQAAGPMTPYTMANMGTIQYVLNYPQKPLVTTLGAVALGDNEYPTSQEAVIAVGKFNNFGIEDAYVLNRACVERGFGDSDFYRIYKDVAKISSSEADTFGLPDPAVCQGMKAQSYDKINPLTGCPDPGTVLCDDDVIIAKYTRRKLKTYKRKRRDSEEEEEEDADKATKHLLLDQSTVVKRAEHDIVVDKVLTGLTKDGDRFVKVRTRQRRRFQVGDKATSRHAQKGVCSYIAAPEDLPFTEDGIVPDIIFNPDMYPSRMTLGKVMELSAGKAAALAGRQIDMTPFRQMEDVGQLLLEHGFHWSGKQTMYDGITGKKLENPVAIGFVSIERLKHMVDDKMHARARGHMLPVIEQPVEGRGRNGALRTGEMERDAFIAQGASVSLVDRLCNCSDGKRFNMCPRCSSMGDRMPDGTFSCRNCLNALRCGALQPDEVPAVEAVHVPQVYYLLQQYLGAMNIKLAH